MPRRNPLFPVGATLHPLDDEGLPPEDYYTRDLAPEIDLLARSGCTLVRLLVGWRAIEPQVGQYHEPALTRLADAVDAVRSASMRAVVCFFADDLHADLAQVPWSQKRDPRTDPYLVQREAELVSHVVERLHSAPGVFAWQLGDEAFISRFRSADSLDDWTRALRDAVREHDEKRPVFVGADAETLFRSSDFDARETLAACELVVAHATASYRAYIADGPVMVGAATYVEPFLVQLAKGTRRVLLDEVGPSNQEYSLAEEAAALRLSVWSALANGASGTMLRRVKDLVTDHREPYYVEPFEALVGVADSDGTPKPSFDALVEAVSTIAYIDLDAFTPVPERVAVVVPAERFDELPALGRLLDPRSALQAFVAAKRAQLPVTVIRESDDYDDHCALIVPSALRFAEAAWQRFADFVQGGGSLVVSYGGGEPEGHVREMLGVDFLGDNGPTDQIACRVAQHELLGRLESFDVRLESPSFALVSPTTATVVATDATGNPLLTINSVGQGRVVFIAAPLERALSHVDPLVVPRPVVRLLSEVYASAARMGGCDPIVTCDVPGVEVALLQGDDSDVLVLVNHDTSGREASITMNREVATLADVRGGESVAIGAATFGVTLKACNAVALSVTYCA